MQRLSIISVGILSALSLACSPNSKSNAHLNLNNEYDLASITSPADASSAAPAPDVNALFLKISGQLKTTMLDCPAKIWPNYNWQKMNVLMIRKDGPSLLWQGSTGKTKPMNEAQIPANARQGLYAFFPWNDELAVSIYPEFSPSDAGFIFTGNDLFQLVIHEGFHKLGQKNWTSASGGRGTIYPIDATPRIYRRMLFDHLKSYFSSNGKDLRSLGQASFWFQKWKTEFPQEFEGSTDGYEGTARYVEMMGPVLSELGCDATDDKLQELASKKYFDPKSSIQLGYEESGDHLSFDGEGYDIGGLSALILRFIQKDQNWYNRMKLAETPPQILLANVTPISDNIPEDISTLFQKSQDNANKAVSPWADVEIQNLQNQNYERISFSFRSKSGSFSPEGFYLPTKLSGITLIPLEEEYDFQDDDWKMHTDQGEILFVSDINPCDNPSGLSVLIKKSELSIQDGKIAVHSAKTQGSMPGVEKVDSSGFTWFCGQ